MLLQEGYPLICIREDSRYNLSGFQWSIQCCVLQYAEKKKKKVQHTVKQKYTTTGEQSADGSDSKGSIKWGYISLTVYHWWGSF